MALPVEVDNLRADDDTFDRRQVAQLGVGWGFVIGAIALFVNRIRGLELARDAIDAHELTHGPLQIFNGWVNHNGEGIRELCERVDQVAGFAYPFHFTLFVFPFVLWLIGVIVLTKGQKVVRRSWALFGAAVCTIAAYRYGDLLDQIVAILE